MTRGLEKTLSHPFRWCLSVATISSCWKVCATFHQGQGEDFSFTVVEDFGVGEEGERELHLPLRQSSLASLRNGLLEKVCRGPDLAGQFSPYKLTLQPSPRSSGGRFH